MDEKDVLFSKLEIEICPKKDEILVSIVFYSTSSLQELSINLLYLK